MSEFPSEEDLRKLPLRAIVAYAVRCARRIKPLDHERQLHDEIKIIEAEDFCRGTRYALYVVQAQYNARFNPSAPADPNAETARFTAVPSAETAYFAADYNADSAGKDVLEAASRAFSVARNKATYPDFYAANAVQSDAETAAYAAAAAAAAGRAAYNFYATYHLYVAKATHQAFYAANRIAETAGEAVIAAHAAAASADYERLLTCNLGDFHNDWPVVHQELGLPIDPSETGPLGALWPYGPPSHS